MAEPSILEQRVVAAFKNVDSVDSIHGSAMEGDGKQYGMVVHVWLVFIIATQAVELQMIDGAEKLKEFFPSVNFRIKQLDYAHQDQIHKEAVCLWSRPEKDRIHQPH